MFITGNIIRRAYDSGAGQHAEMVLKPLNPAYADIVIPNAEAEDFIVVAEVVRDFN